MNEHDDQMEKKPGLTVILRMLIALVVGLLLGFLGSLLFGQPDWSGELFLLLTPLLLGVVGMLTVGTRNKRPMKIGCGTGGLLWFGAWLSFLVWESFQPQTITDCFHDDPPCGPRIIPFWGEYAGLFLIVFLVYLGLGLLFVAVSVVSTSGVLEFARRIRNKSKLSL